jgi:hypothetical protein
VQIVVSRQWPLAKKRQTFGHRQNRGLRGFSMALVVDDAADDGQRR